MPPRTPHSLSGPEANSVLNCDDTTGSITALQGDRHKIRVEGVREIKEAVQHTYGASKPRFDSVEDTIEAFSEARPTIPLNSTENPPS